MYSHWASRGYDATFWVLSKNAVCTWKNAAPCFFKRIYGLFFPLRWSQHCVYDVCAFRLDNVTVRKSHSQNFWYQLYLLFMQSLHFKRTERGSSFASTDGTAPQGALILCVDIHIYNQRAKKYTRAAFIFQLMAATDVQSEPWEQQYILS